MTRLLPAVLAAVVLLAGCQHQQWVVTAVNPDGTSGSRNFVICKPADNGDRARRAYQVTAQQADRTTVGGTCPAGRLLWEMSE